MNNPTKLIAACLVCCAAYGCNGAKTDDQKSKELMRDSVPNDTTTIQYRDTTSPEFARRGLKPLRTKTM